MCFVVVVVVGTDHAVIPSYQLTAEKVINHIILLFAIHYYIISDYIIYQTPSFFFLMIGSPFRKHLRWHEDEMKCLRANVGSIQDPFHPPS